MSTAHVARQPGRVAVGTWSGGRYMHFGEAIDDQRFAAMVERYRYESGQRFPYFAPGTVPGHNAPAIPKLIT